MAEKLDIFKCMKCGNVVEVLHGGCDSMTCCGEAMKHMKEGATDGALEKHVPVIEKIDGGYKVTVGSVAHPMTEEHYIPWIELIADGQDGCRQGDGSRILQSARRVEGRKLAGLPFSRGVRPAGLASGRKILYIYRQRFVAALKK